MLQHSAKVQVAEQEEQSQVSTAIEGAEVTRGTLAYVLTERNLNLIMHTIKKRNDEKLTMRCGIPGNYKTENKKPTCGKCGILLKVGDNIVSKRTASRNVRRKFYHRNCAESLNII